MNFSSSRFRCFLFAILAIAITLRAQSPAISPQNFNALHWRLIGPFRAGRVVAVTGVPGSATDFYFGGVDGGVWKSTDAGRVWKPVFDKEPVASIGAIAVAPSNTNVVYVGTGESDIRSDLASGDGVYKSDDGGRTWKNIGLRDSRQISRILVDPTNANIVYVGVLGHAYGPSPERGVYKSTDGGATWSRVLDKGPDVGIADMAIANAEPNILFATAWNAHRPPWSTYGPLEGPGSGLYRSTDSGAHWTRLTGHGLPTDDWNRAGVAVSPDGTRVYAVIAAGKQSGLYRSDDSGDTWTLANRDPRLTSRGWYFNRVTIDPNHPDVVYVPNVALYRSDDGGKTITIVRGAPGGDDYHELWVDPKDSSRMILGVDQGTTLSLDHGQTWSTWYNQPTAQFYHVITDNGDPYAVYGAQQDSGSAAVYSRTDHGQITPRDWFQPGSSESGYLALDPNHPDIVYLTDTFGAVIRFNRKTSFSQNISPWPVEEFGSPISSHKYRDPWTPVLVFSPDYKTLYLGTQYVMKTTDGGLHWQSISSDLTGASVPATAPASSPTTVKNAMQRGYGVVFTIAPSPKNPKEIWAGSDTGLIHLTLDGGANWRNVTPPRLAPWSKISMIEASRFNAGVAYAAVDRHRLDDYQPYLYRTRDYGKTWKKIVDGIPSGSFLRAVREDPRQPNLLYAGTEFGIYLSFDQGDQWQSLQLNLPVTSVRDMQVHGNDLVIATHGRAFWILDDMTPLRQAAAAQQAQDAYFYQPARAMRIDNDSFLGTPLPPEEPTAKNPPNGAILDYVLKSPEKVVTLAITAANGKVVRHFSSEDKIPPFPRTAPVAERWFPTPQRLEITPGMHRFVWDLRWGGDLGTGSMDTSGDQDDAPHGPRVAPGLYMAKLTVDGKAFTEPITVVMDPRSAATPAVLQTQQEIGLRVYADARRGRQAMAEIESVNKELADLALKIAQNPALATSRDALQKSINTITKGNTTHPGLREATAHLTSALSVVESGDRAVPEQAMELYQQARTTMNSRVEQWQKLKKSELAQFDRQLKNAKMPGLQISSVEREVFFQMTR